MTKRSLLVLILALACVATACGAPSDNVTPSFGPQPSGSWSCPNRSRPCGSEPVCSRADVLFCEDFEDGNVKGWDWASRWDACTTIKGAGGAGGTADALKQTVRARAETDGPEDGCECGYPSYYPGGSGWSVQTEPLYMRFYVKYSAGYTFLDFTKQKVNYFWAGPRDRDYWDLMLGIKSLGSDRTQGEFQLESGPGHDPTYPHNGSADKAIKSGQWYCVEMRLKGNTPGQADGSIDLWVNDQPYISRSSLDLKSNGKPITNAPWLSHYYGGNPCGTHPAQSIWYDQIVIARSRIGCLP